MDSLEKGAAKASVPDSGNSTWLKALGVVVGIGGGLGLIYVAGGVTVAWQLHREHLPAFAIAWQLPREFLIAVAIKVLGWSLVAAFVVVLAFWWSLWAAKNHKKTLLGLLTAMVVVSLLLGFYISAQSGLSSVVACRKGNLRPAYGTYVGRTGDRTYIGEPGSAHRVKSRILALPNDQLDAIFIGGDLPEDFGVDLCSRWEHGVQSSAKKKPK